MSRLKTIANAFGSTDEISSHHNGFDEAFLNKLIGRMDMNEEIFAQIMDDEEFGSAVRDWMRRKVYQRFNELAAS